MPFGVIGGSYHFAVNDFVYLSPPATRYPLPVTRYPLPVTRYPLPVTRYPLPVTRYPLLVTRYSPRRLRRLLLAVDLRPHRQHHIPKHKGIQGDEGDEGDVAAEVEGEHAADEEEEHAAGFFAFEVLPGEDRDPERHSSRRRSASPM